MQEMFCAKKIYIICFLLGYEILQSIIQNQIYKHKISFKNSHKDNNQLFVLNLHNSAIIRNLKLK